MEADVDTWEVNAASLYYCSEGGRSCSTGYDIQQNLYDVIDRAPQLIRPSRCLFNSSQLHDAVKEPQVTSWIPACQAAQDSCRGTTSSRQPWLKCEYKSLSTFWEVQRHIRNHGAVISRITIYNDFNVQIGEKVREQKGEAIPAIRANATAKPWYGHAAVIVGYDNDNYTWTMLNSWGSGLNSSQTRKDGITADGLFKISMGLAGVGAPDQTYGVSCSPPPGSQWDPFGVQKFYGGKLRKNVQLMKPADRVNLTTTCFNYVLTNNDTVASVVDHFEQDIQAFVANQVEVARNRAGGGAAKDGPWTLQNTTYKLIGSYNEQQLTKMLQTAQEVLHGSFEVPYTASMQCSHYDPAGKLTTTSCDATTGAAPCLKYGNGTVNCVLQYALITVPSMLSGPIWNRTVRVCNVTYPSFGSPQDSQPRALLKLNLTSHIQRNEASYCDRTQCGQKLTRRVRCDKDGFVTSIWSEDTTNSATCFLGRVPPTLPLAWRSQYLQYAVAGTLPSFTDGDKPSHIQRSLSILQLNNNRFTGSLPAAWSALDQLTRLDLSSNELQGQVPLQWSEFKAVSTLDLSYNVKLTGCIPVPEQKQTTFTTDSLGTNITGRCPTQRAEVEGRQRAALDLLPVLFTTGEPEWQRKVDSVLQSTRSLSDFYGNASGSSTVVRIAHPVPKWSGSTFLELQFEVVQGALCVTGINTLGLRVNTTVLTQFLAQLPFLRSFNSDRSCFDFLNDCIFDDMPPMPMPLDLAKAAPASLTSFQLTGNNLTGTLPLQWGQWSTIQELTIRANELLSGPLPESWTGMRSLTFLTLSGNPNISGSLPASYGTATWAATLSLLDLSEDSGLAGTVPSSWAAIKAGRIDVQRTGLSGCIPDQLLNTVVSSTQPVAYYEPFTGPCSQNSSDLAVLRELKAVFGGSGNPGLATWTAAPADYTPTPLPGAPPGPAPYHCRNWAGVACDTSNRVSGLELSSTACSGQQGTPLTLEGTLLAVLRKLPWLQSLDLSRCSLQGPLPEALADLANLRQLNLSSNPALSGPLPAMWAAMPHMQLLDVSGCAVTGSVPEEFAAWQELRLLAAAGNRGLGGQLPASWGLMQSLRVLDLSNTSLTGQLPAAWFEATASQRYRRQAAINSSHAATESTSSAADNASPAAVQAIGQAAGPGPKALLGLTQLQVLRLAGNRLTGSMPAKISVLSQLRVLDLSGNALEGLLPLELASLTHLQELQLSGNRLQGGLPDALVRLTQLNTLDLSGNNFTGTLPGLWVGLTQLASINLGSNMLSGGVPRLWGRMANAVTHSLRLLVLTDNPCMESAALQESIQQSGITQGGRVTVQVSPSYSRQCTAPQAWYRP
ncbi:hypothetical protein OEZ86_010105 [Tetradesmus obliquus]|uniref:Peptidase C1A papain C-terminal domain-containing protein n=1 Tax=Tetradesmus obliquus TaxID=3088 RepID=A0ABY8UPM5_TETOB|nr:hypothetical protein OEZ85_001539 [Tetradesmus obliquus]WIA43667.1 hypothetical protein OEZ86_010105 [Tetradesmus obliquus]